MVDIRFERFNYPEAVKPAVFAEIRSEREGVAVQHRAEGASQKMKIESLATLQRDQLLAQAKREATRIRGEGEAKAIETSMRHTARIRSSTNCSRRWKPTAACWTTRRPSFSRPRARC